jgi:hypothetical protein
MRPFHTRAMAGWILALALLGFDAGAAPPAPPGKAPRAAVSSDEAEARDHFDKGVAHFDKQEYREALEEFRKSLELKKTRNAMGYAASCLKQLGQYDDALDQYEEMRREYPKLPAKTEETVAADMAELAGLVGTLGVKGDAPPGASLIIDDRLRGRLPLEKPLRLSVGRRVVRVEKEGFEPITMTVDVKAGQENVAELVAKSKKGRLVVSEMHNWALHVEVDGKEVGVTPWQGLLDLGEHRVQLRGFMGVGALVACEAPATAATEGAKVASSTETAVVKLYEETRVVLRAEVEDASLRVESTPKGATVKIDSKEVGKAPWSGWLSLGEHVIEVSTRGFVSAKQTVQLERRKQRELSVVLEREPDREAELRAAWMMTIRVGLPYVVGAVGLGMFAVAGGLALDKANRLKAYCPDQHCPSTQTSTLYDVSILGTVSTVGLVVAGLGAVVGTTVLLLTPPEGGKRPAGSSVSAGVGLGSFEIKGRF